MRYLFILLSILIVACNSENKPVIRDKHHYPAEYLYKQREYPVGIKTDVFEEGYNYVQKLKHSGAVSYRNSWTQEGPLNIPGRIVDIEGTGAPENKIYAATASGGIFLTEDEGDSWLPIFDDQVTLSIGDMDISRSDKSIIYVGTGEANAGGGSLAYDGFGVFRSDDGGITWEHRGLPEVGSIGRLIIHPTNPDIVYVAAMGTLFSPNTDRGIYKTTDGGITWENILYISDVTGGIDLVMNPSDPEVVYAAMWERTRSPETRDYGGPTSGIFKTTNGGNEWVELEGGLPTNDLGRIGLAIAESDPDVLYTTIARPEGQLFGVFKSTDAGNFWTQKTTQNISSVPFMWWFGKIEVHPTNPDLVYHIGFLTAKSTNGANSWQPEFFDMHVDQHAVWMNPENENEVWMGNDGGVYLSKNGGNTFSTFDNLPTTQFYTCEIDHMAPSNLYGGTQDNGTNRTLTGSNDDYTTIYGGDGFRVLVDYTDNDIIYAESQRGNLGKSTNGGFSFVSAKVGIGNEPSNWNTPVAIHPTNPNILYFGSSILYKSENKANTWIPITNNLSNGPYFGINNYGTITCIDVSPNDKVIAGTDDGNIWIIDSDGSASQVYQATPRRWVTSVSFDPDDDDITYATFSGYRYAEDDSQVVRSEGISGTWTNIKGDLPDIPVNDFIKRPDADEMIIATDLGVFVTDNGGVTWQPLGEGLPNVVVTDIDYHEPSRKLVAATYGRSLFSIELEEGMVSVEDTPIALEIYPNPTADYLNVVADVDADIFQIIGLDGQIKESGKYTQSRIDVSKLNKGVYLIQLISVEKQVYKAKFSKI